MQSYHKYNEHQALERLCERIEQEGEVALITDAGTPAISDPGYLLVHACIERGIEVECLPGATAFVPALVISGLPSDRFVFEGFLPVKKGRQTKLQAIASSDYTTILYESPHRIVKTLEQLSEHMGAETKVQLKHKHTAEFNFDQGIEFIEDENYNNQIVADLTK